MKYSLIFLLVFFSTNSFCQSISDSLILSNRALENIFITSKIDTDGQINGKIHKNDVKKVTKLNLSGLKLDTTEWISAFINLEEIDISNNNITMLDLTKNTKLLSLNCSDNKIEILNLSNNPQLVTLKSENNKIVNLDLRKNTSLYFLRCSGNLITNLDLSNNLALEFLFCDNNNLTSLDLSKLEKLTSVWCANNNLSAIQLSKSGKLFTLDLHGNKLHEFNLEIESKIVLNISSNPLEKLNLRSAILQLKIDDTPQLKVVYLKDVFKTFSNYPFHSLQTLFKNIDEPKVVTKLDFQTLSNYFFGHSKREIIDMLKKFSKNVSISKDSSNVLFPSLGISLSGPPQKIRFSTIKIPENLQIGISLVGKSYDTENLYSDNQNSILLLKNQDLNKGFFSSSGIKVTTKDRIFKSDIITEMKGGKIRRIEPQIENLKWNISEIIVGETREIEEDEEVAVNISEPNQLPIPKRREYKILMDSLSLMYKQSKLESELVLTDKLINLIPTNPKPYRYKISALTRLHRLSDAYMVSKTLINSINPLDEMDFINHVELALINKAFEEVYDISNKTYKKYPQNLPKNSLDYFFYLSESDKSDFITQKTTNRILLIFYQTVAKYLQNQNYLEGDEAIREATHYFKFDKYKWSFEFLKNSISNDDKINNEQKAYISGLIKNIEEGRNKE